MLAAAPTPDLGRRLTQARIERCCARPAGNATSPTTAAKIRAALRIRAADRPPRRHPGLRGERVGAGRGADQRW